jgi:6-phosphogluconolactonase (cycloisomerase 2 family)
VKQVIPIAAVVSLSLAGGAFAEPAAHPTGHAVFVQTNDPAGNAIAVFDRGHDGRLAFAGLFPTGGKGARAAGAPSDPLASQNSLVYDRSHQLLLSVNAGSDSISVFRVDGDEPELTQVVPSGGAFPASIGIRRNLAYVLNAGLEGNVSGFRIDDDHLAPLAGSTRGLGLANANPPFFLTSPAQVGFTPDGKQLVVTTKSANTIDVFAVDKDGGLSLQPLRNPEAPLPFPFLFDGDRLVVANAGASSVATFTIDPAGALTARGGAVSDGQAAACWMVSARGFLYVANTGSDDISQFRVGDDGAVTLVKATAATEIPGATDMASAAGGRFLYVLSGTGGAVHAFEVLEGGALRFLQSVPVPGGQNIEGIATN